MGGGVSRARGDARVQQEELAHLVPFRSICNPSPKHINEAATISGKNSIKAFSYTQTHAFFLFFFFGIIFPSLWGRLIFFKTPSNERSLIDRLHLQDFSQQSEVH